MVQSLHRKRALRAALLLLLMTAGATKGFAQFTDPDGYFKYTITDYENHYVAIGYFPNTTNLPDNYIGMLPSTVTYENVTYTVTSLANSAFGNCNKLLAVGIPETVTSISDYAFTGCENLQSVGIPNSVENIGVGVFYHCTSLQSAKWPENNDCWKIPNKTFEGCTSLRTYTIPDHVTTIDTEAFKDCTGLQEVYLSSTLNHINANAFKNCSALIGVYSYNLYPPLINAATFTDAFATGAKVYVPAESLYRYQTEYWEQSINFAWPVRSDDVSADMIEVMPAHKFLTYENFSVDHNILARVTGYRAGISGDLVIPSIVSSSYVTEIVPQALENCTSITSVIFPETMKTIGDHAFSGCTGLTIIDLSACNEMTTTGKRNFVDCDNVTTVLLPANLTTIGNHAFASCNALASIEIPGAVTCVEMGAFQNCTALTSVTFPKSVGIIEQQAFQGCTALGSITALRTLPPRAYGNTFDGVTKTIPVNIPNAATANYNSVEGWSDFTNFVELPASTLLYSYDDVNHTATITGYIGEVSGVLDIPASVSHNRAEYTVTAIGDNAFMGCSNLRGVTFPATLTSIGQYAFKECTGIASVVIPSTLTDLGDGAFLWCTSLAEVTLPDNLTRIGKGMFEGAAFTEIELPNSLQVIDKLAFYATGLTSIILPESVTAIGEMAFRDCLDLEYVVALPTTPPTINANSFEDVERIPLYMAAASYDAYNDDSLWNTIFNTANRPGLIYNTETTTAIVAGCTPNYVGAVEIPATWGSFSVVGIKYDAFDNQSYITSVSIPASVTGSDFPYYPIHFEGCKSLNNIIVDAGNNSFKSVNGVLFNKAGTELLAYPAGKTETSYDIPYGVETIDTYAFSDNTNLTSINLPAALEIQLIGWHPFRDLYNLTTITVDAGSTRYKAVDGVLFSYDMTELNFYPNAKSGSYTIPNGVTTICYGAFKNCRNLTDITIPNTVTTLENASFDYCTGLTSVVLPSSITTVGGFSHCINLKSVTFSDNLTTIKDGAFLESGLVSLTLPASVTSIGYNAFAGCENLGEITCKATSVPTTDERGFYMVPDVPVYVPAGSISAYQNATGWSQFTNIQAITDPNQYITYTYNNNDYTATVTGLSQQYSGALVIPGTVTHNDATYTVTAIADNAFKDNTGLTSVDIAHTVETIGEYAFMSCTSLTDLIIGRNVKTIGKYAFSSCTSLTNIVYYAVGCENVATSIWSATTAPNKTLTIKNSVRSIPDFAFSDLGNLASVTIPDNTESIGTYAFSNCHELTTVTFGYKLKTVGPGAFKNSGITSIDMNNVENAYDGAFSNCINLSTVTLRNSMTQIWSNLFAGCTALESVDIPSAVTYIGPHAFSGCTSLATLSTAGYASNLTTIDKGAFRDCTALTSIDIPNSVTSINDLAFYGAGHLKNITIGTGLQSMGSAVFCLCSALENITYNATHCYTFGSMVWSGTGDNDKTLTIGANVEVIPSRAFESLLGFTTVTLPNALTLIRSNAFEGCSLTEITIPNNVTEIEYDAFLSCNLQTIVLGSKLNNIGSYAFAGNAHIAEITSYNTTPPAVTGNTFSNYNATLKVLAPAMTAYSDHTVWSRFTNKESLDGYYFTGATDSNWGTASNWSNGTVPTTACIDSWEPEPMSVNVIILADATVNIADAFAYDLAIMDGNAVTVTNGNKLQIGYQNSGSFVPTDNPTTLVIEEGGNLWNEIDIQATVEKNITGYTGNRNGWYFVASPLKGDHLVDQQYYYTNPDEIENLLSGSYDLYLFDQAQYQAEWQNYKANQENFPIIRGKGYLYANSANTTLMFAGTIEAANNVGSVDLSVTDAMIEIVNPENPDNVYYEEYPFKGWNLIGNPFAATAYQDMSGQTFDFYMMNENGIALAEEGVSNAAIPACTGIFVKSDSPQTFTFTTQNPEMMMRPNNGSLHVTLQQSVERGTEITIDKAIVSFNEGSLLEKYVFNNDNASISIPMGSNEYAIAWSENRGEMPINFKAVHNGSYTLKVTQTAVEMLYLHLIDNLTGADVNLLETPTYTFEGKTSDYASRFKLVFACGNADGDNDSFAFFNGSEWVISNMGEATLQVVDMTGRVLSTETVNGNATMNLNQTPGVYMLRLVNGDSVKVQKITIN